MKAIAASKEVAGNVTCGGTYGGRCCIGGGDAERRGCEAEVASCLEKGNHEIFHQLLLRVEVMGATSVQRGLRNAEALPTIAELASRVRLALAEESIRQSIVL